MTTEEVQKMAMKCPWCADKEGLYMQEDSTANKRLRYAVECVCGAVGAPRETEMEAIEWWNTRKAA